MKIVYNIFIFLSLNLTVLCTSDNQFVYSGFIGANLTLDGAATVTTDGLLQLTNGTGNMKGHAFYPTPFHFHKNPDGVVQSFSHYWKQVLCRVPETVGKDV
jgi:hypothetical protein